MTMKLIEGFDHMGTPALFAAKGWTLTAATGGSIAMVAGRINGQAFRGTVGNGDTPAGTGTKTLPSALTGFAVGFAYQSNFTPTATTNILTMRSGATNTFQIGRDLNGHLVIRNSGGTVIATGPTVLNVSTYYYIEAKVVINGASGSVAVQLNGVTEIVTTTGNFGSTGVDNIQFNIVGAGAPTSGHTWTQDWDDIYVVDTSAGPNNDFLGDFHVETLYATADGGHSDYTLSGGASHSALVNEKTGTFPDGDTTYVSDATVGHRDSYVFGDLTPTTGGVFGVQTNLYSRKDDANVRQLAAVVRRSSTDYDGAATTLATTYADATEIRETDPSTSAAWTISGVNAAEFGVKTVA